MIYTTPPNQGIPDKKSKCEEMMRMAQGTLRDDKNAISSHLPSARGGFSGKIVTDGNPSTLRLYREQAARARVVWHLADFAISISATRNRPVSIAMWKFIKLSTAVIIIT